MRGQKSWGMGTCEDSAEGVVLVAVPDVVPVVPPVVLAVLAVLLVVAVFPRCRPPGRTGRAPPPVVVLLLHQSAPVLALFPLPRLKTASSRGDENLGGRAPGKIMLKEALYNP